MDKGWTLINIRLIYLYELDIRMVSKSPKQVGEKRWANVQFYRTLFKNHNFDIKCLQHKPKFISLNTKLFSQEVLQIDTYTDIDRHLYRQIDIFFTHLSQFYKNIRIKTGKYYQLFPKGKNNCFLILFGAPSGLKGPILAAYRANFK